MTQGDLADAVGVTQGAISQIITGKTNRSTLLPVIAEHLSVNYSWIAGTTDNFISLIGKDGSGVTEQEWLEGDRCPDIQPIYRPEPRPAVTEVSLSNSEVLQNSAVLSDAQAKQLGLALIPELALGYSMGGGSVHEMYEHTGIAPFKREWLRPMMKGSFEDLFVAKGEGDSMIPTMLDGDIVLIDTAQKDILQQDRIWALSYGDLGMIKRVRKLPDGGYQINSDNQAVTPMTAYDGEMHVIGRVIWVGRRM